MITPVAGYITTVAFDRAICKGGRWPDDMAGSFVATADGHGGTHITKVQQTHRSPISR